MIRFPEESPLVMPPPNQTASPLRAAADLVGWAFYLTVMGGGVPDLTFLTLSPPPATPIGTNGHRGAAELLLEAQPEPPRAVEEAARERTRAAMPDWDRDPVSAGSF